MRKFTLMAAITMDGEQLEGIPDPDGEWGEYEAKYPQPAASKAFSSVIEYIKRYQSKGWEPYQDLDVNGDFSLVLVLEELDDSNQQQWIYYCFREEAPQGRRVVVNQHDGRRRVYKWSNRVIPMREGETIENALERYEERRQIAKSKAASLANLKH